MSTLSPQQIAGYAKAAGFTGTGLAWAVAVALAESSGNTAATHTNKNGSVDRGLWQINDRAHPEVSAAQAFDPAGAARAAFAISKAGANWSPWTTAKTGAAQRQLNTATMAAQVPVAVSTSPAVNAQNVGLGQELAKQGQQTLGWWLGRYLNEQGAGVDGGATKLFDATGQALDPLTSGIPGVGALESLAKSAASLVSSELAVVSWLTKPHNWTRIGLITLGGGAALAGVIMLGQTGVGGPVGAAYSGGRAVASGAKKATVGATKATLTTAAAVASDGASLAVQGGAKAVSATGKAAGKAASAAKG